jgi:methyltransferase (TIGR00027 family)
MQEGRASRTAERVAMRRAAHQLYDDAPLVFADPLALRVLQPDALAELREREAMERTHPFARGMRAFLCARSRFAEDALEWAVTGGVRQYVVLGAGLDTFGGRSALPECSIHPELRIFEVDHPATQAWKRTCLEQGGIHVPDTVTFVPVDFEREELMVQLVASGFDLSAPAFCSWLGVVPYLTREAAVGTLRALGSFPTGSGVAFDYAVARESLPLTQQAAYDWLAERVARAGEPFRLGFEPAELWELLRECGFAQVEDLSGEKIAVRYFAGRSDGLTVRGGMGRLACAWRGDEEGHRSRRSTMHKIEEATWRR